MKVVYTTEEKNIITIAAVAVLPALLESDLARSTDKTLGREWVAAQSFQIGKAMLEEYKKL